MVGLTKGLRFVVVCKKKKATEREERNSDLSIVRPSEEKAAWQNGPD